MREAVGLRAFGDDGIGVVGEVVERLRYGRVVVRRRRRVERELFGFELFGARQTESLEGCRGELEARDDVALRHGYVGGVAREMTHHEGYLFKRHVLKRQVCGERAPPGVGGDKLPLGACLLPARLKDLYLCVDAASLAEEAHALIVGRYGNGCRLGGRRRCEVLAQPRMDRHRDFAARLLRDIGDGASVGRDIVGREAHTVGQSRSTQTLKHENALDVPSFCRTRQIRVETVYFPVCKINGLCDRFLGFQDLRVRHGRDVLGVGVGTYDRIDLGTDCLYRVGRISLVELCLKVAEVVVGDVAPHGSPPQDVAKDVEHLYATGVFPDIRAVERVSPTVAVVSREIALTDGVGISLLLLRREQHRPTARWDCRKKLFHI